MEGRDLESICQAAVRRIDECLGEAAEVVKSIQLSRSGRRESTKQELKFKPVNLYGSKWLQRIEDSSNPPKVESRNNKWSRAITNQSKTSQTLDL